MLDLRPDVDVPGFLNRSMTMESQRRSCPARWAQTREVVPKRSGKADTSCCRRRRDGVNQRLVGLSRVTI